MDNNILILILAGGALYWSTTHSGKQVIQNITDNVNKAREPTGVYMGDSPLQKTNLVGKNNENIYMRNIGENLNPNTGLPSKWVWANDQYGFRDITKIPPPHKDLPPPPIQTWSKW